MLYTIFGTTLLTIGQGPKLEMNLILEALNANPCLKKAKTKAKVKKCFSKKNNRERNIDITCHE